MLSFHTVRRIACCAALLAANAIASGRECSPGVDAEAFGIPGTESVIFGSTVWDDGSGPDLIAVGSFYFAGSGTAFQVARWDEDGWSSFNDGLTLSTLPTNPDYVFTYGTCAAVYDDGAGPALYVGGNFEWNFDDGTTIQHLAKWDGEQWTQVPVNGPVYHLSVEDVGSGPELLVGGSGSMLSIQPGLARNLGVWNGTQWRRFPELPSLARPAYVYKGVVLDSTGDQELYVMTSDRNFVLDSRGTREGLFRLDAGNTWHIVDDSAGLLTSSAVKVTALEVHDDGTGEALYLGGRNFSLDGNPNDRYGIVRWDGKAWSSVEGFGNPSDGWVRNLRSTQRNGANELVASGNFFTVDGSPADGIAIYRDGSWFTPGAGDLDPNPALSYVNLYSSCELPIDGKDELVVAGLLSGAGGSAASNIARWDGSTWRPLRSQAPSGLFGSVNTIEESVLDGVPTLIVGGQFEYPDAQDSSSIAAFDGSEWHPLGAGFPQQVFAVASVDHGEGLELYAAGSFRVMGEESQNRIARWDAATEAWTPVGSGLNNIAYSAIDFEGKLVVGGGFTQAGGKPAYRIAQWDGSAWSPLLGANGGSLSAPSLDFVRFDDGSGEALYAGGNFLSADGQPSRGIARWDGSEWSALNGLNGSGLNGSVKALCVFDAGFGPEIIAAGPFTEADGIPADGLARWNGSEWSAIEYDGLDGINALEVFDDGSGESLYIGGFITQAGGPFQDPFQVGRVLKWDGQTLEAVDLELNGPINALRATSTGAVPALYIGGEFDFCISDSRYFPTNSIMRWKGCSLDAACPADVSGDGEVNLADLNMVLANFGQTTDSGDTNGDGNVDLADLNAVLAAFGTDCP